jgi:hypothetical protein
MIYLDLSGLNVPVNVAGVIHHLSLITMPKFQGKEGAGENKHD